MVKLVTLFALVLQSKTIQLHQVSANVTLSEETPLFIKEMGDHIGVIWYFMHHYDTSANTGKLLSDQLTAVSKIVIDLMRLNDKEYILE
ncbi:MAG: hypothetical protein IGS54_25940 [Elainella sp. C42_A2020_010]|nr:hypothetical protein [Elainella sp. C42_A2020_010]